MRNRNIKKQVWVNKEEAIMLKAKAKKTGMNESDYLRTLIRYSVIKEKPDDRFYYVMRQLRLIGNNLNQIARKANLKRGYIDSDYYQKEADKWNDFMIRVKKEFLLPE